MHFRKGPRVRYSLEHACLSTGKRGIFSELFYMSREMKGVDLSGQEILNPKGQRYHLSLTMSSTGEQNNVECMFTYVLGLQGWGWGDQVSPVCR